MRNIKIPKSNTNEYETITIEKNMVIVGANGAGKTRFGSCIEGNNSNSKRISAQRYLQLDENVQKQDFETASAKLKNSYKNKPSIQPQNDYQQVLISLFAQESRRNSEYVKESRVSKNKIFVSQSIKEKVIDIWDSIFSYRKLKLKNDKVRAESEENEFSGMEMSDGEKVGLYLISQILLADQNCILIIDEPELHLHKSLMVRLWSKLEVQRKDCIFVYITHDLDFAVNKPISKRIWMQDYKNNKWEWKELTPNEVIPENLYLEILGSRKSILFVEGDKGSLDVQMYQSFYGNFTIIPRESCEKVIESVKGLRNNADLHGKKVFGLIDRDFRPEEQISSLEKNNVFCLGLNKVENLFLIPEIIELVCEYLLKSGKKDEIIAEIKKHYIEKKDSIKFKAIKYRIQCLINKKFSIINNDKGYQSFKTSIFSEMDQEFSNVVLLEGDDIMEILREYPYKGLVKLVQDKLDLTNNGYRDLVLNFIVFEKRKEILDILKKYLPDISLKLNCQNKK
ncbi:DUF4435 domain-containing protein [bacterium]|nr:MAG: DUF4435 domain-containing protein [bacterium]